MDIGDEEMTDGPDQRDFRSGKGCSSGNVQDQINLLWNLDELELSICAN